MSNQNIDKIRMALFEMTNGLPKELHVFWIYGSDSIEIVIRGPNDYSGYRISSTRTEYQHSPLDESLTNEWIKTLGKIISNAARRIEESKSKSKSKKFVNPKNQLRPFLTPHQEIGLD